MENRKIVEEMLEKVVGGNKPEYRDGKYHLQCDGCGRWFEGDSAIECYEKCSEHKRKDCYQDVIL